MRVRFLFPDAKEWRYLIESLSALIDEANFIATAEGLMLRALDPSRIAMVDLYIPRDAFEEYEIEGDSVRIGVNFDDLNKIIKRSKSDERVVFETTDGRLKISFIGRAERSFSLPLLDVVGEELPSPKVTFNVMAKMLSDALRDVLKDAELVSDTIKFIAEENVFIVQAKSDKGEVEAKFSLEAGSLLEYEVKEASTALYGLGYLTDIVGKAYRVSDISTIEFSTNKPLLLTFEIAAGGTLKYYLAPRMEA
ncbi:MAG: proliferating cell nuclear antigen (pcna) [Thermofilum sp. ex4484_79]|nr:MAG: proliferating cell nuclear antigen (pcna) [Thermofilum sp. ex4484_79]